MKIWVPILVFALYLIVIVGCLSVGTPHWLQQFCSISLLVYFVGGGAYLIERRMSRRKPNGYHGWGEINLYPPRLRRWILDEAEPRDKNCNQPHK